MLNRPDKLNSISMEMVHGLVHAYAEIKAAGGNTILMKGEGRAFCSGGDVASVREEGLVGGDTHALDALPVRFFGDEYVLNHTIATLSDDVRICRYCCSFGTGLAVSHRLGSRPPRPDARSRSCGSLRRHGSGRRHQRPR